MSAIVHVDTAQAGGLRASMPAFVIYMHTNRVNGKAYIGQTCNGLWTRWRDHVLRAFARDDDHGCPAFHAAIRKYGPDAFEHVVLETVTSREEANATEIAWIKRRGTRVVGGYNLAPGGNAKGALESTRAKLGAKSLARWATVPLEERARWGLAFAERMAAAKAANPMLWREAARRRVAATTPEQWVIYGRRISEALRARTPEQVQAAIQKWRASRTPEQLSAAARLGWAQATAERRQIWVRNIQAGVDPEKHRQACRLRDERMGPEWRQAKTRKGWISVSPEERRQRGEAISAAKRAANQARRIAAGLPLVDYTMSKEARRWAAMSPEDKKEHGRKRAERKRRARERAPVQQGVLE
jgi:hypothetical protein